METLNVALRNCHGIRELDATFSFDKGNAVAVYAPNGTMKTSFARTLEDLAAGKDTSDHMFSARETERRVTDENGGDLDPSTVVVVLSYDEELGPTEATSTLLVNPELRKEYEGLQVDLVDARDELVSALKAQSGTKRDVIATLSQVFTQQDDKFFEALARISYEVEQMEELARTGFHQPGPTDTDAEAIRVEDSQVVPQGIFGEGGSLFPIQPAATVRKGQRVCFSGARTQRVSCGQVVGRALDWAGAGDGVPRSGYWVKFEPPAQEGDSGAPVYSIPGPAIGLISADRNDGAETYVVPLLTPPGMNPIKVPGILNDPYLRPLSLKIADY